MTPFLLGQTAPTSEPALVWPWAANWQTPISERLEWRTATAGTQSGKEQRRALRRWPRLYFGFSSNVTHAEVPRLLEALSSWRTGTWAVPAWWATAKLTASATDVLALDRATETLWPDSGWALLWRSATDCEPVEVVTVGSTTLTLAAEPAGSWPAGSIVVPLYFAVLGDTQNVSAPAAAVATIATQWVADPLHGNATPEGGNWPLVFPADADTSDPRKALWSGQHNWAEQVTLEVSQPLDIFDPGSGGWSRRAAADLPAQQWSQRVLLVGDAQQAALRRFAGAHRGAAVGFYAVSPLTDVTVTDVTGSDVTFATPIADASERYAGLLLDGVAYEVETWTSTGATLTSAPPGVPSSARLIAPARLASDALEITHHTRDVAEANLSIHTTLLPTPSADATVTSLLLHFDGSQLDEVSQEVFTGGFPSYSAGVFGNAVRSTSEFPGAVAGAWSEALSIGTQPFTIEFRARFNGDTGGILIAKNYWVTAPAAADFALDWQVSVGPEFIDLSWSELNGAGSPVSVNVAIPDSSAWRAFAITDDGTNLRFYVDGVRVYEGSSVQLSGRIPAVSGARVSLYNALQGFSGSYPIWGWDIFTGVVDELRLTLGEALYTGASYTLATQPFSL